MSWFWSDDLARLLIEHDAVSAEIVAAWVSAPTAHRGEGDPLEFARRLLASEREAACSPAA